MSKEIFSMLQLLLLCILLRPGYFQSYYRGNRVLNNNPLVSMLPRVNLHCKTPNGLPGMCSAITRCMYLIYDINMLRQSVCLRNFALPGVCCPVLQSFQKPTKATTTTTTTEDFTTLTFPTSTITSTTPVSSTTTTVRWPTRSTSQPILASSTDSTETVSSESSESTTNMPVYKAPIIADDNVTTVNCGYPGRNGRIIGGSKTEPGQWPWIAAIYKRTARGREYWCGGSLINKYYVLTAAHCLVSGQYLTDIRYISVRLGAYYAYRNYERGNIKDYYISKYIIHPQFSKIGYLNDIALLETKNPVEYNSDVRPICLPSSKMTHNPLDGLMATTLGWGVTSVGGKNSDSLQQVSIPIWRNEDCQRRYTTTITKGMLCASFYYGGKDACQGDSGGPLMIPDNKRRWIIVGIVSFGSKCGEATLPGVYVRVTEYFNWIKNVISKKVIT